MEVPYTGETVDLDDDGRVQTLGDCVAGNVVLRVTSPSSNIAVVLLTPEEAAEIAVNLLRDRSLVVNGRG